MKLFIDHKRFVNFQ